MKRRNRPFRSIVFAFFVFFFIWVLLQFLAPLMIPPGTVTELSGSVGVSDNEFEFRTMSFPWSMVYSLGDRLCHQKLERSWFLNQNQMPFCVRCTAIWIGLAVGLFFMVVYTLELNEKFFLVILVSLVPLGIDGIGQLLGFWESTNVVRFLTGFPAGFICGIALGIIIDEMRSFPFFQRLHGFQKSKE